MLGIVDVNVRALTRLGHHYAAKMKASGEGRILNVASIAAFQPGPGLAVYCASKAYVLSLSRAMSAELEGEWGHRHSTLPRIRGNWFPIDLWDEVDRGRNLEFATRE